MTDAIEIMAHHTIKESLAYEIKPVSAINDKRIYSSYAGLRIMTEYIRSGNRGN